MSITAAALRELHRIHQQLADLRDRLERGPKQLRIREANVTQLEAKLAEAREKAKQAQMAADRKQLDLKAGEQKVIDLKVKLNQANNNREYQSFLEQIAAAEMAGSLLNIKPLIGMQDGVIVPLGRAHSRGQAYRQMADMVSQVIGKGRARVAYMHAGALQETEKIKELVEARVNVVESFFGELSPALAVHTGPGTAGLCYYPVDEVE